MRSIHGISYLLPLLGLQPVDAFWRLACSVSQTARIDPILSPGTISGHVHKFAGGNNVNTNSTHDSLFASTCSTCQVQSDKSAYWTPQLYYQHGDGSIQEVENDGMTVYYVGRGGNSSNTQAFPTGFKMISGNSLLRHYDSSTLTYQDTRPVADRVSFRCINVANDIPETHYVNRTDCVNGLRAQINFQSCWDGVNTYKPDQSHVAYLSGIDYGDCPPTHPVSIPGLFFEVLYWSNRIDQTDGGRFVFANGDTTGYGFHADFLNGWDQDVQSQAVSECLYADNNGVVASCPPLQASNDLDFARTCPESAAVIDEPCRGLLPTTSLPGCNPITSGPADVTQLVCAINSTLPLTSSSVLVKTTSVGATALPPPVSILPGQFIPNASTTFVTVTTVPTTQPGNSTSSAVAPPGSKFVTIAVPDLTTLVVLVPAYLTPDTSYSDLAEATSYIDALTSLASAEAANQTMTLDPQVNTVTVTQIVTVTLSDGQVAPATGGSIPSVTSALPTGGSNTTVNGTNIGTVTIFSPTITLKVTKTAEITVTASSRRRMIRRPGFFPSWRR